MGLSLFMMDMLTLVFFAQKLSKTFKEEFLPELELNIHVYKCYYLDKSGEVTRQEEFESH